MAKSNALYAMAKDFVKRGVPLSGIGLQLHVGTSFDSFDALDSSPREIKRFAALGLEVQFTEVDVKADERRQRQYVRPGGYVQEFAETCVFVSPRARHSRRGDSRISTRGFQSEYPGYGWALPV